MSRWTITHKNQGIYWMRTPTLVLPLRGDSAIAMNGSLETLKASLARRRWASWPGIVLHVLRFGAEVKGRLGAALTSVAVGAEKGHVDMDVVGRLVLTKAHVAVDAKELA